MSPNTFDGLEGMSINRSPASCEKYDPDAIISRWVRALRTPGLKLILDLDENLFDTAIYWVRLSNKMLQMKGIPKDKLPSVDAVMEYGGPSKYYPVYFPEIFPKHTYEEIADDIRGRRGPNIKGPPLDHITTVVPAIKSYGELLGGLTARPATQIVKEATEYQLQRHGLPAMDILYKPTDVPLSRSSQKKLRILEGIANAEGAQGTVVLIDDSLSTAIAISDYNQKRGEKPPIIQVVNGAGSLTRPKIETGQFTEDPDHGIFLMKDWSELSQTIERVNTWLETHDYLSSATQT